MKHTLLTLSLSLSFLAGCQPGQPTANPTPSPSTSAPQPGSSTQPSPTPTALPTSAPTPVSTPTPSPTQTAVPSPEPTATPTPSPTPTATPIPTTASLTLQVFDEDRRIVKHSSLEIVSLDSDKPYDKKIDLEDSGQTTLDDIPAQATLEIIATAPGFNKQTKQLSLDPGQSLKFAFQDELAISTKPEIISVEPGNPAKVDAFDPIVLVFNENMDKDSVEDSLALQLDDEDDSQFDVGTIMPGYQSIVARPASTVYDQRQLNLKWETDRRLVITPKYGWPIGSDKNFRLVLTYIDNSGNGGEIRDNSGNAARRAKDSGSDVNGPFRIGNLYEPYLKVSVSKSGLPNTSLDDVFADNGSSSEKITLVFDHDLSFNIATGGTVVGGANGSASSALAATDKVSAQQAAQNYRLSCEGEDIDWPDGTAAVFSSQDEVRISIPENIFEGGEHCTIRINSGRDVFGRPIQDKEEDFRIPS